MKRTTVVRVYAAGFISAMTFVSAHSFTTPIPSERPDEAQRNLYSQVPTAKEGPPPEATPVEHGEALAYIRIPRFGKNWIWTVAEGTDLDVLATGPGHFTGTALPGGKGNAAIAAHRAGHGDPFIDFDLLQPGDKVILAQNGAEWTYEVTRYPTIIEPDESWILNRMHRGRWLTLMTCWPRYGAEKRYFVRARLVR